MSTVTIRPLPGERRVSYSAAWFVPVDTVTGTPPSLPLTDPPRHPRRPGVGADRHRADRHAQRRGSAILDLGRCRNPAATAPRRYRARFEPDAYLAIVRAYRDGEEFLAYPFDDTTPPALAASRDGQPRPGGRLPLPRRRAGALRTGQHRGGEPVPDVLLSVTVGPPVLRAPQTAQTLTGPDGTFALPLRWAPAGQHITITATDYRHAPNRTGQLSVQLPDALGRNQKIVIG